MDYPSLLYTDAAEIQSGTMSNTANQKLRRAERTRAFVEELTKRFPSCFSADRKSVRPLAIGIQEQLRARLNADEELKDTPNWLMKQALARYTHAPAYLEAIVAGQPRVDLDGNEAGEITDEARTHAKERRDEQRKRAAERRREQGKARRPKKANDGASTRKLEKLASKYNSQ